MDDENKNLRTVASCPDEVEAEIITSCLAEHQIQAIAVGGFTSGFKAEAPGYVQVMVCEEDFERAGKLIAETRDEPDEIDWSQVDVGEPE